MKITKEEIESFVDNVFYENFETVFKENHIFYEHYGVTDNFLRKKAIHQKMIQEILQPISRFDNENLSKRDIVALILNCLKYPLNVENIIKWQETNPHKKIELTFSCGKIIGDGIVLGTDWNVKHFFSNICVVLKSSMRETNLFEIVTAYPAPDLDQSDECWDARDKWDESHKEQTDIKRHSH